MATARTIGKNAARVGSRLNPKLLLAKPGRLAIVTLIVLGVVGLMAIVLPSQIGTTHVTVSQSSEVPELTDAQVQQLVGSLTRTDVGLGGTTIETVYAASGLLTLLDADEPPTGRLIFFSTESIVDGTFQGAPVDLYLRIDDGPATAAVERSLTTSDTLHRTTRFEFAISDEVAISIDEGRGRRLTLDTDPVDATALDATRFVWNVPTDLPDVLAEVSVATAGTEASVGASALGKALRRTKGGVDYYGVGDIEFAATFATPEYFRTSMPSGAYERYQVDERLVFLVSESTHTEDLPSSVPALALNINGEEYSPVYQERRVASPHHRVTLVSFGIDPSLADSRGEMVMRLPEGETVAWDLPISYDAGRLSPFGMTWGTVLALLAGLLASMWPCLFQLTVFFIPTLAGMSMNETSDSGSISVVQRARVIKAALFFVLGFTIVYTAAGAIIGYASQQLGDSPDFEQYQRYFGIGAGILIIILAVRVAAKVRAPLVCKMPVLSGMSTKARQNPASPIELMLAGIAFATGCMTCFGAAMVVAMVVYVGMSSSALFGATILFLFSLGMAIPLVIAATAMAKVLPLVFKLEKVMPWMGLGSSILMIGFAVLLITGNYMIITEFFWRITGNPLAG